MRPSVMARKTVPGHSADLVVQYILQESCRHGLSVFCSSCMMFSLCVCYHGGRCMPCLRLVFNPSDPSPESGCVNPAAGFTFYSCFNAVST
jgi:hypothetical protein